jgi:D-alanine-D-alanine ligase
MLATYRQPLTIQEFIRGFEIEVPVFDADEPSTILAVGIELNGKRNLDESFLKYGEVAHNNYGFYDFADHCPATASQALQVARKAFRSLGLSGVGRIDFRIPLESSPVIIEVACKPHLTSHSSFMYVMSHIGRSHADLLKFLVGSAALRHGMQG